MLYRSVNYKTLSPYMTHLIAIAISHVYSRIIIEGEPNISEESLPCRLGNER